MQLTYFKLLRQIEPTDFLSIALSLYLYIYIYIYVCVCVCVCVCVYIYGVRQYLLFKNFKPDKSVISTQRAFRSHFMFRQNDAVVDRILKTL